jgi:hypothetical protein
MVCALYLQGKSQDEIARIVGSKAATISKYIESCEEGKKRKPESFARKLSGKREFKRGFEFWQMTKFAKQWALCLLWVRRRKTPKKRSKKKRRKRRSQRSKRKVGFFEGLVLRILGKKKEESDEDDE